MGKQFSALSASHREFLARQKVFFVATAAREGRVNLSPKGLDTLCIPGPDRLLWLNLTGSGNETAAHLAEDSRLTLMACAFEGPPLILRVYGQARAFHQHDPEWAELAGHFPSLPGARQVIELRVELVQTSCGFAVPLMRFEGERTLLNEWAEKKGPEGIREYWGEKNARSLDGRPTGIEKAL
jgi:hypothetical protein